MFGLARYEAGICDCGFHESLTSDPTNVFEPGSRTCRVCAGADAWMRVLEEQDSKAPKDLPAKASRDSDGRKTYMRALSPDEAAARRSKVSSALARVRPAQ